MGLSLLVCSYNFFRAITLDPGHIPFATNDMELKEVRIIGLSLSEKREADLAFLLARRIGRRGARRDWIFQRDELLLDVFGEWYLT
jgi:hypothetical protein